MATHFITVLNGVITGQHAGDLNADFFNTPYYGHERIVIPKDVMISNYDKVEFYDESWNRKSTVQLVDEGILPMPEGYLREEDKLRRMTPEERIISGLDEPEPGTKIVDGEIIFMTLMERIKAGLEKLPHGFKIQGEEIVSMTMQEQLAAGQITQEEYDSRIATDNAAELDRRLAEQQTPVALARAEVDPAFAVSRKEKIAALLAVMGQPLWPVKAEWPQ